MREIDPLHNNSDSRLYRALRSLAAASESEPRPEIGETLARAFHRHHARRRTVRRATVAAALLALALPALWLLKKPSVPLPPKTVTGTVATIPSPTTVAPRPSATATQPIKQRVRAPRKKETLTARGDDFLPLPTFDRSVQADEMQVLRVELTGRALRQVGAPVSAEMDDRRILADFVVGPDGTPFAVRLAQRRTY